MESAARNLIKITEQINIEPMKPTKPQHLPLTFFDILLLRFPPVQRVFFFEYPHPESQFLARELPNLKHSLSLALNHFYPLAGTLSTINDTQNPEIRCSAEDSISFTVAVSHGNFFHLSANHARDVEDFHSLVPQAMTSTSGEETAIFAVQVTVFPNAGISVGTSLHHGAADGSTYANFIKTWASFCRSGAANYLPSLDRSAFLTDAAERLKSIFLKDLELFDVDRNIETMDLRAGHHTKSNLVIATFVFSREKLDRLRSKSSMRCSSFSLACGYMWACLIKARGDHAYDPSKEIEYFGFLANCRTRHDPPLPASYFGNCLGICCAEARRDELVGEDGAVIAAEAIWTVINKLERGVFDGVENWIKDVAYYSSLKALTVAGSPKQGIYEVDFGWGRPRKMEVISIERTGALSLAETREEKGGIEVGLVLPIDEMEKMLSIFADGLNDAP